MNTVLKPEPAANSAVRYGTGVGGVSSWILLVAAVAGVSATCRGQAGVSVLLGSPLSANSVQ